MFITDRGGGPHLLLGIEDYQRITDGRRRITDLLAMPAHADIGFELPRVNIAIRPADFC